MIKKPDMYSSVKLNDGRMGTVVDYMGDILIIDTVDQDDAWITIEASIDEDGNVSAIEDDSEVYTLNKRKEVRLSVTRDEHYIFLLGDRCDGEYFEFNKQQYIWLCDLLDIGSEDIIQNWNHYFEYNNFTQFINAYRIVTAEEFYYAYGYDANEKTADALYRFHEGYFERYFPLESKWRKMPEQRIILGEKKARYSRVSKTEGLGLALLI